jgi:hypothetical protein
MVRGCQMSKHHGAERRGMPPLIVSSLEESNPWGDE